METRANETFARLTEADRAILEGIEEKVLGYRMAGFSSDEPIDPAKVQHMVAEALLAGRRQAEEAAALAESLREHPPGSED